MVVQGCDCNLLYRPRISFQSLSNGLTNLYQNRIVQFSFFNATTLVLNAILLYILTDIGGMWYVFSVIGVIGMVGIYNFMVNRKFTFALWITNNNSGWV
ncbi:MAG: GtrA family protein [Candidatus Hodarchaeota archaeon]